MTVASKIALTSLMFKTREYFVFQEVLSQLPKKNAESAIARAKDSPRFTCRFALSKEWVDDDARKTLEQRGFANKEPVESKHDMIFSGVLVDTERVEGLVRDSFKKKVVVRVEQFTLEETSLASAVFEWHFNPRSKPENAIKKIKVTQTEKSESKKTCTKVDDESRSGYSSKVRTPKETARQSRLNKRSLKRGRPCLISNDKPNPMEAANTDSSKRNISEVVMLRPIKRARRSAKSVDYTELDEFIDDSEPTDPAFVADPELIGNPELIDDTQIINDTQIIDDTPFPDDTELNDDTEPNDDTKPIDDTEPINDTQLIDDTEPIDSSQATDSTGLFDDGKTQKKTVQKNSPSCNNTSPTSCKGSPKKLIATLPNTIQCGSPEMPDFQEDFDMPLSPEFGMVNGNVNFMESLFRECSFVQNSTKKPITAIPNATSPHGLPEKGDFQFARLVEKLSLPDSTTFNASTSLGEDVSKENCSGERGEPSENQTQVKCSEMDGSGSMPCLPVSEDTSDIQEATAGILCDVTEPSNVTTQIELVDLTRDKTTNHNSQNSQGTTDLDDAVKDPVGDLPNTSQHQQHDQPKADECQNQMETSLPDALIQKVKTEEICDETVRCACIGLCNNQEATDIGVLPAPDKVHNTLCDSTCNLDSSIGNPPSIQKGVCGTETNQELNTSNSEKVSGKGKSLKYSAKLTLTYIL